jgi:hypothetical protein
VVEYSDNLSEGALVDRLNDLVAVGDVVAQFVLVKFTTLASDVLFSLEPLRSIAVFILALSHMIEQIERFLFLLGS